MIVKNEEETLCNCLETALDIMDEIIIVDTGSNDKTKEIAARYTDKVYDYKWMDDFASARNFSFSKASCDFCMWLDADDVLMDSDRECLKMLKKNLSLDTDFVMCRYNVGFDQNDTPVYSYYRERIIRNDKGFIWNGVVHEAIDIAGNILYTDIAVTHRKIKRADPERNLRILRKKLNTGIPFGPREQFYYARELCYAGEYQEAVCTLTSYLDSGDGWIENKIEACRILSNCYFELNEETKAVHALLRSFLFDIPRAEVCCDLGNYFTNKQAYMQAIYWYKTAASCSRNDAGGGFIEEDCYGYIPYIQMCLCYESLGNRMAAYQCNQKAGEYKAYGMEYLNNREFYLQQEITDECCHDSKG